MPPSIIIIINSSSLRNNNEANVLLLLLFSFLEVSEQNNVLEMFKQALWLFWCIVIYRQNIAWVHQFCFVSYRHSQTQMKYTFIEVRVLLFTIQEMKR